MADYKFDIFLALGAVDKCDGAWFAKQTEEVRKAFAAPVFLRWAASVAGDGINHEYMLCAVNDRVNVNADIIMSSHPELMFRLAASCGVGRKLKHEWVPTHGRRGGKANKAFDLIARFHPSANDTEIEMLMSMYTKETFKAFAEEAGLTPEEVKDAVKSFGK